jgi:hypothetical protein
MPLARYAGALIINPFKPTADSGDEIQVTFIERDKFKPQL